MVWRRLWRILDWVIPTVGAAFGIWWLLLGDLFAGTVQLVIVAIIIAVTWLGRMTRNPAEQLDTGTARRLRAVLQQKPLRTSLVDRDAGVSFQVIRWLTAWHIYRLDEEALRDAATQINLGAEVVAVPGAAYSFVSGALRKYMDAAPMRWVEGVGWKVAAERRQQRPPRLWDQLRTMMFYRRTGLLVVPAEEVAELIAALQRARPESDGERV